MTCRTRMFRRALLLAVLATVAAHAAERSQPPLQGPIADFWNQVRRDWAKKIPGLRSGPTQTGQWVSLIYGGEGEDLILDNILAREMQTWAKWQRRNWVRAEFWRKRYDRLDRDGFYGSKALRKNLVVMGTPAANPMVVEMTAGTPFHIEGNTVRIGARDYQGSSLVLVFIRRNPFDPQTYALVIAATGVEALLDLGRLPIGSTDYVLFRGAHAIDAGFMDWTETDRLWLTEEREQHPDHLGWDRVTEGPVTVHFHPQASTTEEAAAFAAERAGRLVELERRFDLAPIEPLDIYVYDTADGKLRHTGEPGPVSVDLAAGAVHRVYRPGEEQPAWPEAMVAIWRAWGATELRGLLFGLALLADPDLEGQPLDHWAARLAVRRGLPDVDNLLREGPPWRNDEGDRALQSLGLGSFFARLEREHGIAALQEFYTAARALSFRAAFRDALGRSLSSADREWRRNLPVPLDAIATRVDTGSAGETATSEEAAMLAEARSLFLQRRDDAAEARLRALLSRHPGNATAQLLLARIAFRGGRDEEAITAATEAARLAPGNPDILAWARVTLGRAHAARGELQSAQLELDDPAVRAGPAAPRHLAELWMENLGLSMSRAATARYLTEQAEIDLQYFDWDAAERRALQILSSDPGDVSAHHLLARIRMEKFGYWFNFVSLYNELFPGTTPSDPLQYFHLVQSSQRETMKGVYLETGALSPLQLDRAKSEDLEEEWLPDQLYPTSRVPDRLTEASNHMLRGRAFFLAGDYRRAASHFRSALGMVVPVSDGRAWTLYLLALCERELGQPEQALVHLQEAHKIGRHKSLVRDVEQALAEMEAPGSQAGEKK